MILSCKNICKAFETHTVLDLINFQLEKGEKAAIVGLNGAGKSTLFKIITKELEPDSGQVIIESGIKLGYLSQHSTLSSHHTIMEEMLKTCQPLIDMENKLRTYEEQMAEKQNDPDTLESLMKAYAALQHDFEVNNGYGYKSYIRGVLKGLGFVEEEFDQGISTLSGGQKTRVALAQLLLTNPDILLLDEPTNHLDIKACEWLEGFLSNYHGTIVIISHDRYFLDKIVSRIIEIENTHSHIYNGHYSFYVKHKAINREIALKHYLQQQKEIKRQEEVIRELRSHGRDKLIKRAQSREKQLSKLDKLDAPAVMHDKMNLRLEPRVVSGNEVINATNLSKSFDDKHLFLGVNFHIKRGEKVALIGDNGTGKTTLFRIINQQLEGDTGFIDYGAKVKVGYYDQEHATLNPQNNLIEEISDAYPTMDVGPIRNTLAAFLFTGDDVFKPIHTLSGGEKGRLTLAKLMLSNANFLLLDEPTNHLDMVSKEILESAISHYNGTVFFISHDRYFINKVATRVLELTPTAFNSFLGNYNYYVEKKLEEEKRQLLALEEASNNTIVNNNLVSDPSPTGNKADWLKNKEEQANKRKLENQIKQLEKRIHELEKCITDIDEQLCLEEIYTNAEKAENLHNEKTAYEGELEGLYEKWESLL
ncbi:ABC-F family ATP-binding cassette domain-containing protein [Vallitalea pronyensis]|uniref:ABC-F family ATP-binding cassette domain-containing protein n=1 Tax=Vallitalea pronyensis TaxID=1348613 RepID=A0A8J8MKA9_9FIRM|nr:ABC-F family ATP-binding cassette domain-containing protein [Vallitalea pronyensis]QUI22878.1 ABC-F family ATP-binding cassette domain-containing protein [Vallitalea pronyensis]